MSISALSSHHRHYYTPVSTNGNGQNNPFSKLEDSSGNISRDSFVKNRPQGVSESDAGSLFDKIDSGKTGSLTESQLVSGLQQYGPQAADSNSGSSTDASTSDNNGLTGFLQALSSGTLGSLLQNQQTGSSSSSSDGNDPFAALEGSDGKISKDSFVKNRPSGVSESDASSLFDKIDTSKSGELTSSQLQDGLKANAPNQADNANGTGSSENLADLLFGNGSSTGGSGKTESLADLLFNDSQSTSSTSQSSSTKSSSASSGSASSTNLDTLLKAIQSYSSNGYGNSQYDLTSSLLQLA